MIPETVRLPTDKVVLVMLGLTRQGGSVDERDEDGWRYAYWEGLNGGAGRVAVRVDDEEAVAALAWIRSNPAAYVVLCALLPRLVDFDGAEGAFRLERVAELLYGPRRPASHRERQLEGVRSWLVLLERGYWELDGEVTAQRPAKRARRGQQQDRKRTYGAYLEGHLVRVTRQNRCSATVELDEKLAKALRGAGTFVPPEAFLLPLETHANAEGNMPSLVVQARQRLGGAFAMAWRRPTSQRRNGQGVRAQELLEKWAGLDLAAPRRRRRLAGWLDVLVGELRRLYELGSDGVAGLVKLERDQLATMLRFTWRTDERGRVLSRQRAPGGSSPPSGLPA